MIDEKDIKNARKIILNCIKDKIIREPSNGEFEFFMSKSEQGIHALTYNALIYYFLDNDKKIEKHIIENYNEIERSASEILARDRIETIKYEMEKRKVFTYNMGINAEKSKAETSLKRAKEFLTLIKELTLK
jgi:hypothetical protein